MMSWLFGFADPRKQMGGAAEDFVANYFTAQGATLVARNYRCAAGEIDLIVMEGSTLVFVEVKSRSQAARNKSPSAGPKSPGETAPELRVGAAKRAKLRQLANLYLNRYNAHGRPVRFDVLAVEFGDPGCEPVVRHYRDAFGARD